MSASDLHSRRRAGLFAALAVVFVLLAPSALSQTGKLAGSVMSNGEPLIGANVFVMGSNYGASVDVNGNYVVLRIPPGTYTVRFSSIGYQTRMVEGVRVSSNQTTELDAMLGEQAFTSEAVVVTAKQPIVDVTQTSSVSTIGRDEIDALPVQALADVVNLQAGVVDGHFRGGRLGEVQYQVDGVSVNNPYNNTSTVELDRSVLQEVQVISGTFDAEYGQALSGVVNAVLRSGDDDKYEFTGEVFAGDYVSPGNDSTTVTTFFGDQVSVARIPYISDINPFSRTNVQLSLSGPVPIVPNTTFIINGQRLITGGRAIGERRFVPTDSSDFQNNVFIGSGNGEVVQLDTNTKYSWLGKITNNSIPNVQLSYQAIGATRRFLGNGNYNFRFNPDGIAEKQEFSLVHGVDIQHVLGSNTFYEVGLRQNLFDYKDYYYADPFDARYYTAGAPAGSLNYEQGAIIEGIDLGRFVQRTNAYVAKVALTTQMTTVHLLKMGAEFQRSAIKFGVPGAIQPVVVNGIQRLQVVQDTLGAEVLRYDPVQAAAFVQDRVEWGDLRVRAGLRLEYFNSRTTVPSDLANPANSIAGAPASLPVATSAKWALAPRLGVSFPFLSNASLFFSYGHFYQLPGLGLMFENADYTVLQDLQAGAVSYGVLGNPDLKPEFTAQYEFGFKSEIVENVGLDVSLFYKDISDLLGVEFVQTYTAAEYARFTNVDFGGVRGFTIALDQRNLGPVSTTLDYTNQIAVGNSSDPRETANRAASGGDPRPREVPFTWDQRHTLNATVNWSQPGSFSLTGILRAGSGQPYTPTLGTGFGADLEPNSGRKAFSAVVDLRGEKVFRVSGIGLTAFARVLNLFDTYFFNGFVYSDTGSAFYTLDAQQQINPNPGRFNEPRRIEIGMSFRGIVPAGR